MKKNFVFDYGYIGGFYGARFNGEKIKSHGGPIRGNIKSPLFFSMLSGGIYFS